MSDINHNRMIPLHVADQAVANCEKEIAELQAELERSTAQYNGIIDTQLKVIDELKAEVERLKKPAVIGGYNISEYIRMANSETLEFDNGDIFADITLPERIKYIVESHAHLQAEVERLRASSFVTAVPVEQYERVVKAGSEMSAEMRFAWLERIRTNKEQREAWLKKVHQCLIDWEAAKEGKQP